MSVPTASSSSCRQRPPKFEKLEEAVNIWFAEMRSRGAAVSDEMLQEKAKEFGTTMGYELLFVSGLDDAGCGSPRLEAGRRRLRMDHTKTWKISKRGRRQRLLQGQGTAMSRFSHRVFYGALRHVASTSGRIRPSNRTLTSLSYFHKPGKNPFLPWTMGEVVDRTADAKGDNIAIVSCHQGIAKTFTELRDEVNQFAASLVSLKLPLGSKIGMLAPNIYEWMVVKFAVAKAGLVLVNINTAYQAPELELCLNHTKCAALIVAGKFCRQSYYEMLLQIAPELDRVSPGELKSARLPLLKHVIMINDSPMRTLTSLSYFHKPGKNPFLPWTMGEVVDRTADAKGDNIAIVSCHQGIAKTFTELRDEVNQFAASLVSLKLPLGSKIGMLAPNIYEWMVVKFAVAKAGLVLVNINTAYQAPELELCLNHTKCAALIVAGKFCRQSYYEMLLQIAPELDRVSPGELKSARLPLLKHVIMINDSPMRGTVTFDELMKSATAEDYAAMNAIYSKLQFDEAVNIQFTSGTTGRPKAAMLSHFNVVNNANLIGRGFGLHEQSEVICLNAPMMHCYGIVVGTLTAAIFGSTTVMPAPSFKAEAALEAIAKHRCTFIYGTPTMFIDMLAQLERGNYDLSSVRKGA
ncbi:medium-chain acyl-CoA ligase ACSF2, mitochondrial [Ixodes scapularis]